MIIRIKVNYGCPSDVVLNEFKPVKDTIIFLLCPDTKNLELTEGALPLYLTVDD